jgi:DNA modification methylase
VSVLLVQADARALPLADGSVQACITSPPYWGLRDYGTAEQLGAESLHDCLGWATGEQCGECYVCHMVDVFREVRRALRDDGVLWLNLGDSYAGSGKGAWDRSDVQKERYVPSPGGVASRIPKTPQGLKPKDRVGVPARVALALQADGWWWRSECVWHKPNPMPSSVKDRPTDAHEMVYLFAKSTRYFYDADAVRERFAVTPHSPGNKPRCGITKQKRTCPSNDPERTWGNPLGRNRRSVWTIATRPYSGAHFAAFPPDFDDPLVRCSTRPGDVVLDPFAGTGTTGMVAVKHGRRAVLCDVSRTYLLDCAAKRTSEVQVDMLSALGLAS